MLNLFQSQCFDHRFIWPQFALFRISVVSHSVRLRERHESGTELYENIH